MGYIHKNTTLILIFFVVVSMAALAGATVYYQRSFQNLHQDIGTKDAAINQLASKISSLQENLSSLEDELDLKIQREEDLGEQYQAVSSEREDLLKLRIRLSRELNDTKKELDEAEEKIDSLDSKIRTLDKEILTLTLDKKTLEDDIAQVIDDTRDICQKIEGTMNVSKCEEYQ